MQETETKAAGAEIVAGGEETGESRVALPASEFEELIQKAARAAVREYRKQEEKEKRQNKYHNTFTLMKCYRDAVFHIQNAVSDGEQLELKGMTEEQQRVYLESVRRSRFKASRIHQTRCKCSRYRIMYAHILVQTWIFCKTSLTRKHGTPTMRGK